MVFLAKSKLTLLFLGLLTMGALGLVIKDTFFAEPGIFSWNQQVTLTVETIDGIFSSSTVQQVTWRYNGPSRPGLEGSPWSVDLIGESPVVLLPDGSAIFPAMGRNLASGFRRVLVDEVEKNRRSIKTYPHLEVVSEVAEIEEIATKLEFPRSGFPQIFGIRDPANPFSTFVVSSSSTDAMDSGISEVTITVEKTNRSISEAVAGEKIPGLLTLPPDHKIPVSTGAMSPISVLGHR